MRSLSTRVGLGAIAACIGIGVMSVPVTAHADSSGLGIRAGAGSYYQRYELAFSNDIYLEAGVGVNRFSHTRFADKTISTQFQFGSHVGVGVNLSPGSRLGLRYSHYSNAAIKRPNDGLDVFQLTYTHAF